MKVRADTLLVAKDLAETRAQAAALIMAGAVLADDKPVRKAGDLLPATAVLRVKGKGHPYVGRGALKLEHGLAQFNIDVAGLLALDVGSSTGGFTEVLLARGAAKVYAVDVGTNQLAWKLRQDARVISLEQTDARRLTATLIPEPPQIVVCDASFIGLRQVLPAAMMLAAPGGMAGGADQAAIRGPASGEVGPGGIVTDVGLQANICAGIETAGWARPAGACGARRKAPLPAPTATANS